MLSILISALTLVKAQSTVAYTLQALLLQNSLPTQYPALTQTEMIAPNLVNSAFLAPYISYVKSVVPASILSIAVSTYNPGTPSTPTYNSDKVANCYWPDVLCTRNTDTAYIKADISTCPNQNDWGLTFDDGPVIDPRGIFGTPQLLNALEAANIKATFFGTVF